MPKCLVIGGGLAGISAAVHLSRKNFKVTLIESSPKLGGRTHSFRDKSFSSQIDNGQHLMLGCYRNTLEMVRILGSEESLLWQERLSIPFRNGEGGEFYLRAKSGFYPLNILSALLRFELFSVLERINLLRTAFKLLLPYSGDEPFAEWLSRNNAGDNEIKYFWKLLAVGALNADLGTVSTKLFRKSFRTIFMTGGDSFKFILFKRGLSELFAEPAIRFLENHEAEIRLSEKAISFSAAEGKIKCISTNKNKYEYFDAVVCTIPHFNLLRLGNGLIYPANFEFNYAPIVTIHISLSENPFSERFYSLLGSGFDWLFVHDTHVSMIKSAAWELAELPKEKILKAALSELDKYFTIFHKDLFIGYKVLKERKATFIPDVKTEKKRSEVCSNFENFILAGDWTNTGLPATIEGAVHSGKIAAQTAADKIK